MAYQRFNFDSLPIERQKEIIEKQKRQQEQREMLIQQCNENKKRKEIEKGKEEIDIYSPRQPKQQQYISENETHQQTDCKFQSNSPHQSRYPSQVYTNQAISPRYNIMQKIHVNNNIESFSLPNIQQFSVNIAPRQPLLGEKLKSARKVSANSVSVNIGQMHDSFNSLRFKIRSTAANTIINLPKSPQHSLATDLEATFA